MRRFEGKVVLDLTPLGIRVAALHMPEDVDF